MKAEIKLEIEKEDLNQELKNLVKKTAQDELKKMINEQAKEMVKEEINKILHPLVLQQLTEGEFYFNDSYLYGNTQTIDDKIKGMVTKYLNTSNYLYSKSGKTPSEKYMPSSSGGEKTSLISHIVSDSVRDYVDTEFAPKVREMINEIVQDKDKLQAVLKEQAKELVLEKMK